MFGTPQRPQNCNRTTETARRAFSVPLCGFCVICGVKVVLKRLLVMACAGTVVAPARIRRLCHETSLRALRVPECHSHRVGQDREADDFGAESMTRGADVFQ